MHDLIKFNGNEKNLFVERWRFAKYFIMRVNLESWGKFCPG